MIRVGTSGFSYADWVGPFYPASLSKQDFLRYYSRHFETCELNFSYYRIPTAQSLARMLEKSGGDIDFVVKANKGMTHERTDNRQIFADFHEALVPLLEAEKCGCVLAQFPYSFHATQENLDYLKRFKERMQDVPLAIEFRNHKWIKQDSFSMLKELDCGFCCVDEPALKGLLPPLAVATSQIGYVRFHGRNRDSWWQHEEPAERYDYLYSEPELQEWVPKIQAIERITERTYVFMNNHPKGNAVQNAKHLQQLLYI
ncbi:MAG: DUF72 domain-containing protein [bacterium]|nr:DUF72 domain-containing protein [bacterium]